MGMCHPVGKSSLVKRKTRNIPVPHFGQPAKLLLCSCPVAREEESLEEDSLLLGPRYQTSAFKKTNLLHGTFRFKCDMLS